MRLTLENIDDLHKVVNRELAAQAARVGTTKTCNEILESIAEGRLPSDHADIWAQIFRIIWFLEHATREVPASHKSGSELTQVAEYLLNILGVKPYKSKFSFAYSLLYNARAKFLSQCQDPWLSIWSIRVGKAMDGTESRLGDEEQLNAFEMSAIQYFRCGFISDAVSMFQKAESFAKSNERAWRIRVHIVRCLRILNQTNLALDAIAILREQATLPPDLNQDVLWETAFIEAQRDRDVAPLLQLIAKTAENPTTIHPGYMPLAILWCYASKQRAAIDKLPSASWLKSRIGSAKDVSPRVSLIKLISHIEDFYSTELSIFHKLKNIGEVLGSLRSETPSVELTVFYAATARCLLRLKQKPTAALALNVHQSLSLALSCGGTHSLFDLMADIGDSLNATADSSRTDLVTRNIKTGLERTFMYIEITAKLLLLAVVSKTKSILGDTSEKSYQADVLIKLSQFFVKYAGGTMKGPVHKLAQALLNLLNLPEEAQTNFKSVLWSKTIVHESLMRRVLEEDLKQKANDAFARIDWNPIGVGSVSQVYRAELKTGEQVVIKIQYPDLDKIVQQDMDLCARILSAVRWMFPRQDLGSISQLLLQIYQRETNFLTELEVAKLLSRISERGALWRIPTYYPHLCSERVLVSQFIDGINFYEFSETASFSEKNEVAKALHQFGLLSVLEGQIICIDPHPANLIISDGQVVMIDFGCFVPMLPDFCNVVYEIARSYILDSELRHVRQLEVYRQFGIITNHPSVSEDDIREFVYLLSEQLNWENCMRTDLQTRLKELYLHHGINKVFGVIRPEFALGLIAQILLNCTINKFGVPRSEESQRLSSLDMEARMQKRDTDNFTPVDIPNAG